MTAQRKASTQAEDRIISRYDWFQCHVCDKGRCVEDDRHDCHTCTHCGFMVRCESIGPDSITLMDMTDAYYESNVNRFRTLPTSTVPMAISDWNSYWKRIWKRQYLDRYQIVREMVECERESCRQPKVKTQEEQQDQDKQRQKEAYLACHSLFALREPNRRFKNEQEVNDWLAQDLQTSRSRWQSMPRRNHRADKCRFSTLYRNEYGKLQ